MKYYCKIIYKDKIEPTLYLKNTDKKEIKKKLREMLTNFFSKKDIFAIFIGKKE